MTYFIKMVIEF